MDRETRAIRDLIVKAAAKARRETDAEPEPELTRAVSWPVTCTVGPGLEGAIASETRVGYVNGAKGWLIYRGYDVFDLCAHSTYEEVCFLLLRGRLPRAAELEAFRCKLAGYRRVNSSLRLLLGFPIERMNAMAALRLGTHMMRQEFTFRDREQGKPAVDDAIASDEDSIAMETPPCGATHATFEFTCEPPPEEPPAPELEDTVGYEACCRLIAGVSTIAAAVARVRQGRMAIEPDPGLSHAANLLYMITGRRPTPVEERIMDVALILHADHGMNASTFAAMVVASTLSDIYFSVGSGIGALSGPLHGGANEQVIKMLCEIGGETNVRPWLDRTLKARRKVFGFGHRVYKAYDPRARVLGPLAERLARGNRSLRPLFRTARALEREMIDRLGVTRGIFPNVDFYSGLVYSALGIPAEDFTPIFAVSRVAGWTARVLEYLENNRIFRPRAIYVGGFGKRYPVPRERRA